MSFTGLVERSTLGCGRDYTPCTVSRRGSGDRCSRESMDVLEGSGLSDGVAPKAATMPDPLQRHPPCFSFEIPEIDEQVSRTGGCRKYGRHQFRSGVLPRESVSTLHDGRSAYGPQNRRVRNRLRERHLSMSNSRHPFLLSARIVRPAAFGDRRGA